MSGNTIKSALQKVVKSSGLEKEHPVAKLERRLQLYQAFMSCNEQSGDKNAPRDLPLSSGNGDCKVK